jgi:adenosyl cobinamide kinase/adenosyl cobinamide phosphate guanylyltransferase
MTKAELMPQATTIPAELYQRLIKLNDNIMAVNTMMEMFQKNCQAKIAQHNSETREVWAEIKRQTGLDMETILWAPSQEERNVIIPIQIMVNKSAT